MDKLSLEMIQCQKDGYGVHYGRWKAKQPVIKPAPVEVLPEGWKACPHCGKWFEPKHHNQKYCDAVCCYNAQKVKDRSSKAAYDREYRARKKAQKAMLSA